MSKEDARHFAAGWGKDDQIEQAIMALPREQRDSIEAIARVARDLGYAITHEELAKAFAEEQKTRRTELKNVEISIDDLDQVAGGGDAYHCKSDYDPNDWCWVNDRCTSINVYYRSREECQETYDPDENCWFNDNCNSAVNLNYPTNPKRANGLKVF